MNIFNDIFNKLRPVKFQWKETKKKSFGFIAQDLLEIFPDDEYDVVVMDPNGMYRVNYYQIIPILVSKIRDLEDRIKKLEG